MRANSVRKEQIFLSYPHTNNGFFFLLTTKTAFHLTKHVKVFQKIPNSLKCDMVTSSQHYNDVWDRRAATVPPTYGCSFFRSFPWAGRGIRDRIISHEYLR